ncbi:MAG TPA: hypothetical protein ENK96_11320 [Desulfobulbaceae bacterium]|nr:hypothetical protein [Desulfobulbaceae bacterium]
MTPETAYLISFGMVILMKIVCFILGYLTVRLGYELIASGVKGEFKFSAQLGGAKAALAGMSPGLLFVFLGVFLIGYAMYVEKGVELKKMPQSQIEKPSVPIPQGSIFDTMKKEEKSNENR